MKPFLKKISIIVCISLLIFIGTSFFLCYKERNLFLFVSNSASLNAKAAHAYTNPNFNNAQLLVVGSSMTLNNIAAGLLEDSLNLVTYNFASWGLKMNNMIVIPAVKNKYIYTNISFIDLERITADNKIEPKYGYPLSKNPFLLELNVLNDCKTFTEQLHDISGYANKDDMHNYSSLVFDANGSVLLPKEQFHIDSMRWNEVPDSFSTPAENTFIQDLGKMVDRNKQATIFISFSPPRKVFYTNENAVKINAFFTVINRLYKNVHCFNNYGLDYPDSLFVDNTHFNKDGAIRYSTLIADSLKTFINKQH